MTATRVSRMLTFGARRPRMALAMWLAAIATLTVLGLHVGQNLASTTLDVPGTESAREAQLAAQQFGNTVSAPVLLSGPRAALEHQGAALAERLAAIPGAAVLSPWSGSPAGRTLRRSPNSALELVAITADARRSTPSIDRSIQRAVDQTIGGSVHARVSGLDTIGTQLQSAALSAVHQAELIAMPVLLIVLLIVFGSPVAAAIPAALGLGTVFAGFGIIYLLASFMPLTEFATSAASMMGLALGVDYSLLVVSRFRDELTDPNDPAEILRAAGVAGLRAGRTAAFAGGAIAALMLCALAVAAGTLLLSAVVGVIIVAAVSVASTLLAAPAGLVLLGRRMARRGRRQTTEEGAADRPGLIARTARSPAVVIAAVAGLLAVSWHALSLATGPPDARQLPGHSRVRLDYEALSKSVGPGWVTPFELLVGVPNGTVSTRTRLDVLNQVQQKIARDPDVAIVVGPGALASQAKTLEQAQQTVASTNNTLGRSAADVGALQASLGQASAGANRVQAGFAEAASAVNGLAHGATGGNNAIARLSAGLAQAAAGSRLTNGGLMEANAAAGRVVTGGQAAAAGANRLTTELSQGGAVASTAGPRLASLATALHADTGRFGSIVNSLDALTTAPATAEAQLQTAMRELSSMGLGRFDRHYGAVASALRAAQSVLANSPGAGSVVSQLSQLNSGEQQVGDQLQSVATSVGQLSAAATQLEGGAQSLQAGIGTLERGQEALAAGIQRLATSGSALTTGLGALSAGTQTLGARLSALQSGAASLASGLSGERQQTASMASALTSGERSATTAARTSPSHPTMLGRLAHNGAFFRSGYLVLAALQGTPTAERGALNYTINLARNGQAARMLIVPRSGAGTAATGRLRHRLELIARQLGASIGGQATVGGPAAQLRDYATAASGRMPMLIGVLMLATFVLLVPVFRSLFAPLVGVLLNLLSVAAAFGTLSLLAGGPHPLIGGPGYVDSLSVSAMFAAVFALSVDYQVFLLMRMREGFVRTGSVVAGVEYGVSRTARVVVGAAAIMAGVFLAFASADVATVRQLGIGLAIAIALDSTVVRLVLLPCALRLGGRFTWWLPGWLDKRLPTVDIGAERRRAERADAAPSDDVIDHRPASTLPAWSGERVLAR